MSDKLLKIPATRFVPAKAFANDVFLHLALNGRYIRIAKAGDDISPDMLSRMAAKGIEFLYVATDGQENLNPDTYPLYVEAPKSEPVPESKIAAAPPVEESSQSFSATPEQKLEETRISADKAEPEGSITIKGSKEEKKETSLVFSNKAEFDGEGALLLAKLKAALISEKLSAEANTFRKQVVATPLKDRKKLSRDFTALAEACERAAAGRIDASLETKYSVEEVLSRFAPLGVGKGTEDLLAEASDRTVQALKEVPSGQKHLKEANRLIKESEAIKESPALAKLSKKLEKAPVNETEKLALIQDVKNTLMVDKISEEILKFSASHDKVDEQRFSADLSNLEEALTTISNGEKLNEEMERRFSADKEAEQMVTVFSSGNDEAAAKKLAEQVRIAADRRDKALEELSNQSNDGSLTRAKTHRDMPSTASRLAAYLGYSLGYTDLALLSDLALTAVLHFAKRDEDAKLSQSELPAFVKTLMSGKASSDFVTQDAMEILQIIDAYLNHPECDREQKDFVKRVFDRTILSLMQEQKEFDAINLAKWMSFVEKGPDITGHSICVKASANAVKQSKSIII